MDKQMTLKQKELEELYSALVKIDNVKDCKDCLDDLLTAKELDSLSGRVHCAKLFIQGKTYIEVTNETTVSSATLARVSKCVKQGKGYNKILKD
jgi:TrpR-related protein YerC/YecD